MADEDLQPEVLDFTPQALRDLGKIVVSNLDTSWLQPLRDTLNAHVASVVQPIVDDIASMITPSVLANTQIQDLFAGVAQSARVVGPVVTLYPDAITGRTTVTADLTVSPLKEPDPELRDKLLAMIQQSLAALGSMTARIAPTDAVRINSWLTFLLFLLAVHDYLDPS